MKNDLYVVLLWRKLDDEPEIAAMCFSEKSKANSLAPRHYVRLTPNPSPKERGLKNTGNKERS
jgi:hypothetical protein